jgi:uncharacterized protein (TIGR02271 family)
MLDTQTMQQIVGSNAYAQDGEKLGKVGQVFLDDQSGQPEFVTVNTGMFGTNESFVPVADATVDGDRLVVPFSKDKVKDAPNISVDDGHISEAQERQIYEYYGMGYSDVRSDSGLADTSATGTVPPAGHDTSGPNTDDAMTRSEEQLRVGTEDQETGRVRLRKYVETEHVTQTVPVRKERAVLEREPITDSNVDQALSGGDITEEEHEVTLREERPVVEKRTEPVERVRVGRTEETDNVEVSEELRKEQIDVDGDTDESTRR